MAGLQALVEKHYENLSTGNLEAEDQVFSSDVVFTDPASGTVKGLDALIGTEGAFLRAFPDIRLTLHSAIESGNRIVAEGTMTGTFTGGLMGPAGEIPPTNRSFTLPFADFFEVEDGKVTQHRIYWDQASFLGQLGLMPSPQGAG